MGNLAGLSQKAMKRRDVSASTNYISEQGAGNKRARRPYRAASVAPWLDELSADQVDAIVAKVLGGHPNLRAAILFGSISRHDERSLDDPEPSDVDLLLLFDLSEPAKRLSLEERLAISHSIVSAVREHPGAPREINVFTSATDLSEWHEDFVANLVQDGMALWARRPLPALLAQVERRADKRERAARRGV